MYGKFTFKFIRKKQVIFQFSWTTLYSCWRRSWRGHDNWLTWQLDSSNLRLLTPSPVLGMYQYIPPTISHTSSSLEKARCCWDHLDWICWLNPSKASVWTFKVMVRCRDLGFGLLKASLLCKFPCLLNMPPNDLEWPGFLWPQIPALCVLWGQVCRPTILTSHV